MHLWFSFNQGQTMMRLVLLLLGVALAVNAQTAGEDVVIGNRTYFMGNDAAGVEYSTAQNVCLNQSKSLVGFDLINEQSELSTWFRNNRRTGKYWTNGLFIAGSGNTWQWGTSGVQFDDKDANWSQNPVSEPDGDTLRWEAEHVSYGAIANKYYSDSPIELNHVMCE
ncbi:hypothetical protein B566_EDAN002695 [Ephemera danica]|nr:hypothetical protein B566_EDAN002695 [Ephemera danica]